MNDKMIAQLFDIFAWGTPVLIVDQFVYCWAEGRLKEVDLHTLTGRFVDREIWYDCIKDSYTDVEGGISNTLDDCYDVDGNIIQVSMYAELWINSILSPIIYIGKLHWLLMKQLCLHGFSIGAICQLNRIAIYNLYLDQLPWKK